MIKKSIVLVLLHTLSALSMSVFAQGQYQPHEPQTLEKATGLLNEFMTVPDQHLPDLAPETVHGLVIVPRLAKLKLGTDGYRGKGIAVVRGGHGKWRPPAFVTLSGGRIDLQAGMQSADLILLLNSRDSVRHLLAGELTLGVDATVAAGPVGQADMTSQPHADIFSYCRRDNSFAGIAIDGSVIKVDAAKTQDYYRTAQMAPDGTPTLSTPQLPLAAAQLLTALDTHGNAAEAASVSRSAATSTSNTGTFQGITANASDGHQESSNRSTAGGTLRDKDVQDAGTASTSTNTANTSNGGTAASATERSASASISSGKGARQDNTASTQQEISGSGAGSASTLEDTRQQLAASAKSLGALLDTSWRQYLGLPKGIFTGEGIPTTESLRQSLTHFETVAKNREYDLLLKRPEFQQTHDLLQTYCEHVEAATSQSAATPPANGDARLRSQ